MPKHSGPISAGGRALALAGGLLLLAGAPAAPAQTADRSAVPPNPAIAVPAAPAQAYTVQNGELIVAPGLRIPNGNVPWALDTVDGKRVLVPIHHAALQGTGSTATMQGASARTPLHSAAPEFFVHSSDRTENNGDAGRSSTGWALVAPEVTDGSRSVVRVKFSDVSASTVCTPPVLCTAAEALPDGWIRITPKQALPAGEYALLPVSRSASTGSVAYDFSIDLQPGASKDTVVPGQNLDVRRKKR